MPDWSRGVDENNSVAVANGEGAVTSWQQAVARRIRAVHPRARTSEEGGQVTRKRVRGFVGAIRECVRSQRSRHVERSTPSSAGIEAANSKCETNFFDSFGNDPAIFAPTESPSDSFRRSIRSVNDSSSPRNAHANHVRGKITVIFESS